MKLKYLTFIIAVGLGTTQFCFGQVKYFTRTGHISFFSEAALENIEAHNQQGTCILNCDNGEIAISVLMKGFEFEKALMQEHFNENYVESHKFPKSTFKGKITNFDEVNLEKNGKYNVQVAGELFIHGETKKVTSEGSLEISDGTITAKTTFPVTVEDYNIKIPKTVINNIAEVVEVSVELALKPYNR